MAVGYCFVFVDDDKDEKVTKATFSFGRATAMAHELVHQSRISMLRKATP
jgi:hypothetical protein